MWRLQGLEGLSLELSGRMYVRRERTLSYCIGREDPRQVAGKLWTKPGVLDGLVGSWSTAEVRLVGCC
jgi:hypothetical protein